MAAHNEIIKETASMAKYFPYSVRHTKMSDWSVAKTNSAEDDRNRLYPQLNANKEYLLLKAQGKNVFAYYENGIIKYIETDEAIAAGLEDKPSSKNIWLNIARIPAQTLRAGSTTFSLRFLIRNPIRDALTAFIQSKNGFLPIFHSLKGLRSIIKKDEHYQRFLESGGSFASFMEMSDADTLKMAKEMFQVSKIEPNKWKTLWKYTLGGLEKLNETMEQMTRVGAFIAAKNKGLTDTQAGFEAREVTLDFARMGKHIKNANQVIPFFNAGLQGISAFFRHSKQYGWLRAMKLCASASLLMEALNLFFADDDDREEFLEIPEHERMIFWHFKIGGKWIKIPKPPVFGFVYGSLPEMAIENFYKTFRDENTKEVKQMVWEFILGSLGNLMPVQDASSIIPPIVKVPAENLFNYSLFMGRPLYSPYLDGYPDSEKYGGNTTNIAKKLGKITDTSPATWDNIIRGFFGTGGADLTNFADFIVDSTTGEGTGRKAIDNVLSATGVGTREPIGNYSRSVWDFRSKFKKLGKINAVRNSMVKTANKDTPDYIREHSDELRNYEVMKFYNKTLKDINDNIKKIENSNMDAEWKQEQINEFEKLMTETARKGLMQAR